ncbi:hypothetical protein J7E70_25210 [Variovorax paradoxus]|nr:tripartite tricarboxylate transporter substrate-binding protein [Variovorax paradoxus]MBT2303748.1 hypothetical protein [Variovorax paradoxus]
MPLGRCCAELPFLQRERSSGACSCNGSLTVAAPAGTPKPIVQRLADEIRKATQQPDVQQKVATMGFELKDSSPEAFTAAYKADRPVWERLIKQ